MRASQGRSSRHRTGSRRFATCALVRGRAVALLVAAVLASGSATPPRRGERWSSTGTRLPRRRPANTRYGDGSINSKQRRRPRSRLDAAADRAEHLRRLRRDAGDRRNSVIYSQDLDSNVQAIDLESGEVQWTQTLRRSRPRARTASSSPTARSSAPPRARPSPSTRKPAKSSGRSPLTRKPAMKRSTWRPATTTASSTSRRCRSCVNSEYHGRRRRHALGARRENRQKSVELRHRPEEPLGQTRSSTPAAASGTRRPSTRRARCTSVPATRRRSPARRRTRGARAGPGPNLYTNSMVKLDAKTGKMDWYYQQTPHDLYDWDFQDPPILINAGGRDLAIGAGQVGDRRRARRRNRQAGLEAPGRHPQRPRRRRPAGDAGRNLEDQDGRDLPRHPRRRDRADGGR